MKDEVTYFLEEEINRGHLPGAVVQVMHEGDIILREVLGNRLDTKKATAPMREDTVFDLASLTKVVATLPAVLKLIDEGDVRLDDSVGHFFPEFAANGKEDVRLRHLLTHTSGLPAHRSFYKENLTTDEIIQRIHQEKLVDPPESKVSYSDLGFILLYHLVEHVTDQPFEVFLAEQFYEPLGMNETGFQPTFRQERYAATEYSETRGDYKQGVVHDENAESMGGISGHAGLFSTIDDLTKWVKMIENEGEIDGERYLSESALTLARTNFTAWSDEHRGLGWMMKSPTRASCGDYFRSSSYGHTGFTGTSIWFDPTVNLNVILLTNRVHYGRQPHMIRLRPRLHNLIRRYF